jgi:hypothetical protein
MPPVLLISASFPMATKENTTVSQFVTEDASVNHTATWTIENFPLLRNTYKYGEALFSPEFEIKMLGQDSKLVSTIWHIECYPSGDTYERREFVVLYLCHSNRSELERTRTVNGTLKFRLVTQFTWRRSSFALLGGSKSSCASISHKDLSTKPENYLIDSKLELKFEISLLPLAGWQTHQLGIRSSELPKLADVDASAWGRQAWSSLKAGVLLSTAQPDPVGYGRKSKFLCVS